MTPFFPHDPVPKNNVMHTGSALLTNDVGLHARPSVKLTQLAKRFGAHVEFSLAKNGPWVDAKSPVKVMRFKAAKGETLHFRASGSDATEALAAIVALVERGFATDGDGSSQTPRG
jgi:phosphocarrier protein HPr